MKHSYEASECIEVECIEVECSTGRNATKYAEVNIETQSFQ